MDNRLVLTVLFVTLSWISVGINAQTTAANNMTTSAGNMTGAPNATNMTTAMGSNAAVATNMTTAMGSNATVATNMTTAMGSNAAVATNMTTAMGSNATVATNMTTAAGHNMTNATMAPHTTAITTAAPLEPNTAVQTLQTELNNSQCGTTQLCAAEPSQCDPSASGSCFFLAARQQSGQNFEFGLAGESEGYIAASLSLDNTLGGNDTTYVCANDNGTVKFFGTLLNNGQLTVTELRVNSVKGKVTGKKIECTFAATVPSPTTRASTFTLGISSGAFNSSSGSLGAPSTILRSAPVDLANPTANVTNEASPSATTAPPSTTASHAITLQQSLTHALLIAVGVLGLAML